ncbi:MAG TPA: ATP-binding protein [Nitrospirales bacterium]|nr:ATP-binding protein [Nitrospirales bacterium]
MKSFRNQIRHSALSLVIGLLAGFTVLVYWSFEAALNRYVDSRLVTLATTLGKLINDQPHLLQKSKQEINFDGTSDEEQRSLREASHSIQVLSPNGEIIWKGAAAIVRSPITDILLSQVQRGQIVHDTIYLVNATPVRRVSVPVPRQSEPQYIIQAETSLRFSQEALSSLFILLAGFSSITVAIAWLGSDWVARKALSSLKALSAAAENVTGPPFQKPLLLDPPYQEFSRLTNAFNAMLDRLQKIFEGQRHFVDHAAHEMQTPLTVLQANIEVTLQKARTVIEYREALLTNLEQVERLGTLTRSLLILARFSDDRYAVQLVPLELEPLVQDLISELMLLAKDQQILLTLESQPVPLVMGDRERVKQLLINLLDNAMRYTSPGGTVVVRMGLKEDYVAIAVEDTGVGIEPEHLPRLFDRFYRTDTSRVKNSGGTGLGLPIVKEIAEAHRGTVTVQSEIGNGSVFTLLLPPCKDLPQSSGVTI